jgi:hypothetical protein
MRDYFVKHALRHPAFKFMTPVEVVQSIENRLWNVIQKTEGKVTAKGL